MSRIKKAFIVFIAAIAFAPLNASGQSARPAAHAEWDRTVELGQERRQGRGLDSGEHRAARRDREIL